MIDVETLRELIAYDADTGKLVWLPRDEKHFKSARDCASWNAKYAGREAFGTMWPNGYKAGHIFSRTYLGHRVAWALANNCWPNHQIDHINGNRSDNRLCNLREATPAENQRNVKQRNDNTSGAKGVDFQKSHGLWRARIVHNKRRIDLGKFNNLDDAISARKAAERQYGYHENHGRAA